MREKTKSRIIFAIALVGIAIAGVITVTWPDSPALPACINIVMGFLIGVGTMLEKKR